MEVTAAPIVAWQQAAVIILFIIFLGGVFGFLRWILNWTSKMTREMHSEWQAFLREQGRVNQASMCEVVEALKELGLKIDAHDEKVEERITRAVDGVTKQLPSQRGKRT